MPATVKTLCPYCGVGCGLELVQQKVRGDRQHPSSQGMICVKGGTIMESVTRDRLLYPMMRDSLEGEFQRVSWDQALDRIVERIQVVRSHHGADGICVYGSGQFQTEDYYVAQKLLKGCLGTNNFDANSRLCMSSAVSGYIASFGSDGPPCCYDDLEATNLAVIVGSNTAECHPIIFNRLRKHHKSRDDVRLIVIDPRYTPTAEAADLHLAIAPGSDIALFHGIAHLLHQWQALDHAFIAQHTQGWADLLTILQAYPPPHVANLCQISTDDLHTAARWWQESDRVLSLWSMGINQSVQGTAKVQSLINLHLMTGQIGKDGAGPFSLTGQPNAMGGREAGGLAHLLPGYRLVSNSEHRAEVEQFWGLPPGAISSQPGHAIWDMIRALEQDQVGLFWIAATNPAVSLPDLDRVNRALRRSPLTVYQEAYHPTETTAFAHILLPATQWSEKTGVMTNSERVVTLCPAFQPPLGEARDDWQIFAEVGKRLGYADFFPFQNSSDVYAEFARLTHGRPCDQSGISHHALTDRPIQWPCPAGTAPRSHGLRLYRDHQFPTPDRRARFGLAHHHGLHEPPNSEYPLIATTGRLYGHWHTMTRTGRIAKIQKMHPEPLLEIHPRAAAARQINDGDRVEIRSRRGKIILPAKVTKAISPQVVFVPMHWGALWADNAAANALTDPAACPISKQPELKACAVQVTNISLIPARCSGEVVASHADSQE
ncbi:MAG: nitrate reductase [Oscillatoriales cyanobacterium SM2_2_1]|nr:nitrate reductase [Oscillatoriales cyanobacterium SM2_2_1]